jgi:hypothetical protein
MVERVARALAIVDGCNPDDPAFVRYPSATAFGVCWRDKYATKARAAIEAMREPTEVMLDHWSYRNGEWSRQNIEAFVDAALTPTPTEKD